MPKFNIKKSIVIDAPAARVYDCVSDFKHWTSWSPWLIMEPEATVNVSDDGNYYEWEGKRVGSGNMRVTDKKENEWVDYDLTFLKPWKSTSRVRFELTPKNGSTGTDWYMFSSLPFFMFWMKKMMIAYVGNDYERGLKMLKDYAEDGQVHSELGFRGIEDFEGCTYVGIHRTCAIDESPEAMSADFDTLQKYFKEHKELISGNPFTIYQKWDMVGNKMSYTSGFPVKSLPGNLPDPLIRGEIPSTGVYTLRHTGTYEHLGNGWSTMYNLHRAKEFKMNKKIYPFESYRNMPGEVPDKQLITDIHFPVK